MNYIFTIRARFEAIDDVEARQKANELLDHTNFTEMPIVGIAKLQKLRPEKQPEPVSIRTDADWVEYPDA